MHRSVADLVHTVRILRPAGILRRAVRHSVRQELEQTTAGPEAGSLGSPAGAAAATYQPLTGRKGKSILTMC